MMTASAIKAAIVSAAILSASTGLSPVAAQQTADIGYVEGVSGRVVALVRGAPALVNNLDVIDDRTRFDLLMNSELRLCHYGLSRFVSIRGPARIVVSADGIKVEAGRPVEVSPETCLQPRTSNFQGGIMVRGVK